MKISKGRLLDDDIWLNGWIVETLFKKVFFPLNSNYGFDYQVLYKYDKNKIWVYV